MLFYSATLRTNEPTDSCIMPHSYVNPPFSVILDELEFAIGYYQTSLSIFYPLGPPLKAHTLGLVTVPRNCVPSWGFSFLVLAGLQHLGDPAFAVLHLLQRSHCTLDFCFVQMEASCGSAESHTN